MTTARSWREIKAEAHRLHPELADPARQARARAELDSYVAGHHFQELRKAIGHKPTSPGFLAFPSPVSPKSRTATSKPWGWTHCAPMPQPSADISTSPSASAPTR